MNKESLILGKLLKELAPQIGAKVFLEPKWGVVGKITFKSGKNSFFKYNTLDINPVGASDIAKDKGYANLFMKQMGYPIIPGSKNFFSDYWVNITGSTKQNISNAYRHACLLGFPVIIKPNSGSQGTGVSLVYNKREFYKGVHAIFEKDNIVLVQKLVIGKDYRLVVLDNKVISAYQRIPLSIIGDGHSTIIELLKNKQKEFLLSGRDTRIAFNDPRIKNKLKRQKLTLQSIPIPGKTIYLLDNANLSTGGDSLNVINKIHSTFKKLAIQLTKDMGLRFCGVDLIINGDISKKTNKYWILEINAAPGLDHYAKAGEEQKKIVSKLYLQVLKSLEK